MHSRKSTHENFVPAIIDRDVFDKVQFLLENKGKTMFVQVPTSHITDTQA